MAVTLNHSDSPTHTTAVTRTQLFFYHFFIKERFLKEISCCKAFPLFFFYSSLRKRIEMKFGSVIKHALCTSITFYRLPSVPVQIP